MEASFNVKLCINPQFEPHLCINEDNLESYHIPYYTKSYEITCITEYMHALQTLIVETRQNNKISIAFSASKLGISESVLIQIENTPLLEIDIPHKVLQTYLSRYAEYLGIKQESITPALYVIEKRHSKTSKAGKKTWFDYLNRTVILLLLIFLAYSVHSLYQKNKQQPTEHQTFITPPTLTVTSSEPSNITTNTKPPSTELQKETTKISQDSTTINQATTDSTHNAVSPNSTTAESEQYTVAIPPSLDQAPAKK